MKKVLILGSDGFLGNALLKELNKKNFFLSVDGTSRRRKKIFFDFSQKNLINFNKYDVVVIAAAITDIDFCEKNKKLCKEINYKLTVDILKKIKNSRCFVVFISSNAVFDGSKQFYTIKNKKNPKTFYGKSKSLVEDWIIAKKFNQCCILRFTKILPLNFKSFYIKKWQTEIKKKKNLLINKNHYISPISISEAVESVRKCILRNKTGIFQKGGKKEFSYYEFAKKICFKQKLFDKIKFINNKEDKVYNSLKTNLF